MGAVSSSETSITSTGLHGVTSQNPVLFIDTAVRTSDPNINSKLFPQVLVHHWPTCVELYSDKCHDIWTGQPKNRVSTSCITAFRRLLGPPVHYPVITDGFYPGNGFHNSVGSSASVQPLSEMDRHLFSASLAEFNYGQYVSLITTLHGLNRKHRSQQ
jgi:hypothetical protein